MGSPARTLPSPSAERIRVRGLVQGVGFRPTVWRLANARSLRGRVWNDGDGVQIELHGEDIDGFVRELRGQCPPLARIDGIERQPLVTDQAPADGFVIEQSRASAINTGIVPDAATCPNCLAEVMDPSNRRHAYPFTNCTHCGPRLSIVRAIPYDRANTSMAAFTQCPSCQHEYDDPADRRFHAQPNACPVCGPTLWLETGKGARIDEQVIESAAQRLLEGDILAIKGIGGFHLACDATNPVAVRKLRQRKQRPAKPFALMLADLPTATRYAEIDKREATLLQDPAAPIVLLRKQARPTAVTPIATEVAPGQSCLGLMLPYTPLHHLLLRAVDRPLVMTSANRSDEPQCIDNQQARERLADIADHFLMHNRDILNRIDDSVRRVVDGRAQTLRRARGLAPTPITLPPGFDASPNLLALGGELKNAFCLVQQDQAILSQHMGDLEDVATWDDCQHHLRLYRQLFGHRPEYLAVDRHPEYLSSKYGRELAQREDLRMLEVQHHHAHIAACLGDNQWPLDTGPVLGLALDGLGYGDDGSLWGGEFLLADYRQAQRLAHLAPAPMPGGTQAIREPWRNTFAHLHRFTDWEQLQQDHPDLPLLRALRTKPLGMLEKMLAQGLNSPETTSAGRWFEAVGAAIGLCPDRAEYEGQAAIELEAMVTPQLLANESPYQFDIRQPARLWQQLVADLAAEVARERIATRFHLGMAKALRDRTVQLCRQHGVQQVALSGGVFQNKTLLEQLGRGLRTAGLTVLTHKDVPPNDGGLAFGQALVALARLKAERSSTQRLEESPCV